MSWTLGPIEFFPFGLGIAFFAIPAFIWMQRNMGKAGLKSGTDSILAIILVPLAFLFSRLGYCLFIIDEILGLGEPELIFHVRDGGQLLFGAILGGLIAVWLTSRFTHQLFGKIVDTLIGPVCLMIVSGRIIGGLFVEHGLGLDLPSWFSPEESDFNYRMSLWALDNYSFFEHFPFAVKNYYDEWCWAIFMLEALYTVFIYFIVKKTQDYEGGKTAKFFLLYACGQVLWEAMLRGDVLHLPYLGFVRANQILCAVVVFIVLFHCLHAIPKGERAKPGMLAILQVLGGILIVVAMEFAAFEKKITAIAWLPADACHLIMACGCLWMYHAVLPLWKKKYALSEKVA